MSISVDSEPVDASGNSDLIGRRLADAQKRIRSTDIMTAAVTCGIWLIGYLLLFTISDHWLIPGGFTPWMRAGLLALVLAGVSFLVWKFLIRPLSTTVSTLYAARILDRESASAGALLSLVDLQQSGSETADRVYQTIEDRATIHLRATSLDDAVDRGQLIRMGVVLFGLILATCVYSVLSPKPISLLRPLSLLAEDVATTTRITNVTPGDVSIPLGGQIEITADISGVAPDSVRLLYTTADHQDVDAELQMEAVDETRRYRAVITGDDVRGIRQATTYQIYAGDSQSERFSITVAIPPTASVRELRYQYLKYMQLDDRISSNPNIDTWEGTTVTIDAESTVSLVEADIELSPDRNFQTNVTRLPANVNGTTVTAEVKFAAANSESPIRFYRIAVQDQQGTRDPSPIVYTANIRPDAVPVVELRDPTEDQHVPANAIIPLLIRANDPDFLLRSVALHYAVDGKTLQPGELIYDAIESGYQKTWTGTYDFSLSTLDLQPGNVVRYWIGARDNKSPRSSVSFTPALELKIQPPAKAEQLDQAQKKVRQFQKRQLQQMRQNEKQEQRPEPQSGSQASDNTEESQGQRGEPQTPTVDDNESGLPENKDPSKVTDSSNDSQSLTDNNNPRTDSPSKNDTTKNGPEDTDTSSDDESTPMSDAEAFREIVERYSEKNDINKELDVKSEPKQDGRQQDGRQQDGVTQDGVTQDGATQDGATQDGATQDGATQDGATQDGRQQDGARQDGRQQDDSGDKATGETTAGEGTSGKSSEQGERTAKQGRTKTDQTGAGTGANQTQTDGGTSSTNSTINSNHSDLNLDDEARAANLALQQLERDIERGEIDANLLNKLGWTADRLRAFEERMSKQLQKRESTEADTAPERLQRKRVEALLRSLDLNSKSTATRGTEKSEREQQDTTIRRRNPPVRLRSRNADYRRRILEGRRKTVNSD